MVLDPLSTHYLHTKLPYANPFSMFAAFAASPMFTQSRRTKFGARWFANWVQPYALARILQEPNNQKLIK